MIDETFHLTPLDVRRYEFGRALRGYDPERVDQFREQAAQELDSKKRARLYDDAQKLLTESDAAIVPLYWKSEATLLNPKFVGLEYNSMARMDLRNVKPATK